MQSSVGRGQYTITLRGRVQEAEFRGYTEDLCRRLGIRGITYDVGGDLKILCEGDLKIINRFYRELQKYRPTEIEEARLEEGVQLPYQLFKVPDELESKIIDKLDEGIRLLRDIRDNLRGMRNDMKTVFGHSEEQDEGVKTAPIE